MRVFNALQIKKGAKGEGYPTSSSLTQPIQFLPAKKKNDEKNSIPKTSAPSRNVQRRKSTGPYFT